MQSSVQDWGEEVEEGAIYNVTLKRVQIQQAANKGARWLGVSRPVRRLSEPQPTELLVSKKETVGETDSTNENPMLLFSLLLFLFPLLLTCRSAGNVSC